MIKALHPAEHALKAESVPASSRYPTVVQETISTAELKCPEAIMGDGTGTWCMKIVTHTNPLVPVEIWADTTATGSYEYWMGSFLNQTFAPTIDSFKNHSGAEFEAALNDFGESCEAYRITALSTTGVFVGASLTDQGSIVSGQFYDGHQQCFYPVDHTDDPSIMALAEPWVNKLPSMSALSMGTLPYVAAAKEGWYAPQKLLCPGAFHRTDDLCFRGRYDVDGFNSPMKDLTSIRPFPFSTISGVSPTGMHYFLRDCDDGCSVTYVTGLAKTTTFRCTLRLCLELGVSPTSRFASFARPVPPPDDIAIELYQEVVKELVDAYPAEYNDLGKFFDKIKGVVRRVAGVLEPVAGIASAVGVPYASVVKSVLHGVNSDIREYIDDPEGLKADAMRAKATHAVRVQERKAKLAAKQAAKKANTQPAQAKK